MPATPECWIVGPIAWDWPYRLDHLPRPGGVGNAKALPGRLGGTGANVARAVASRGHQVRMVGYVGKDELGSTSLKELASRGVDTEHVATLETGTSQVLLFVEPTGERTIISIVEDELERVRLPEDQVARGDLVYFAGWRGRFGEGARAMSAGGAVMASVPFVPSVEQLPMTYVIGSRTELPVRAAEDPYRAYFGWTSETLSDIVLTCGEAGAVRCGSHGVACFDAFETEAVDSTGAGDAFAAALLVALLEQRPLDAGVLEGLRWGAATAARSGSIPVPWSEVP